MQATITIPKTIHTNCPTCTVHSQFEHVGEQKWSVAVAEKLGIPTIVQLYNCDHCHTTLTDIQLKSDDANF